MMSEKKKYISPDAEVFLAEKDVLTTSGLFANDQIDVKGNYGFDQWKD